MINFPSSARTNRNNFIIGFEFEIVIFLLADVMNAHRDWNDWIQAQSAGVLIRTKREIKLNLVQVQNRTEVFQTRQYLQTA